MRNWVRRTFVDGKPQGLGVYFNMDHVCGKVVGAALVDQGVEANSRIVT